LSNALISNGVYAASKMQYMKHFIAMAVMFQSRPDCLEYLNEKTKDKAAKEILTWKSLYESGVTQLVKMIETGGQKIGKSYKKDDNLHLKSSKILMTYMKQIVNDNKVLTKLQWKSAFQKAQQCFEEFERIEKVMQLHGIEEHMKTKELKEYLNDLIEVIYLFYFTERRRISICNRTRIKQC
jgi:hypothetical protein